MPQGLPGVSERHQPHLRELRQLCLLRRRPELLRRALHQSAERRPELRRVRQKLRGTWCQRIRRLRFRTLYLQLRRWHYGLQRDVHLRGFRSEQLRCVRQRLSRHSTELQPGGLQRLPRGYRAVRRWV